MNILVSKKGKIAFEMMSVQKSTYDFELQAL